MGEGEAGCAGSGRVRAYVEAVVSNMDSDDDRPILTIDLAAILANRRLLASRAPGAEVACCVKADAYGLGMARVGPALAGAGAKTFFVATVEEGVALRALLPAVDIYVLNGLTTSRLPVFLAKSLRPCLKSLADVKGWVAGGGSHPVAFHIDSGINRLGLGPDEVTSLAADRKAWKDLNVTLVMSHLACGDDPDGAMNRRQLDEFHGAVKALGLGAKPLSIAASSGIFLGPDFHLAMVRPGAALYGLAPLKNRPNPMRQVLRLEGKILQTHRVDTNMSVGYGASHLVRAPGRIATIGIGYADGFRRALGNRGFAVLGDRRVPIVGHVSMDLTTLDVSALPAEAAMPGEMVELIGPSQSVDDLAEAAGTIGYEILTGLGRRFHRIYVRGGEPVL